MRRFRLEKKTKRSGISILNSILFVLVALAFCGVIIAAVDSIRWKSMEGMFSRAFSQCGESGAQWSRGFR